MLLASFCFAIMGGFVKLLVATLPSLEVTFFRNIFGVVIILLTLWKVPLKQIGGKPWLLIFRGAIGFISLLCYFYVMAYIPLGVATTYNKTSPIFVALFAYLFLNEKLPRSAIIAVVLGFGGILLVAQPEGFAFSKYDILGVLSGIGAALAYTSIRELRQYYDTRAIVLSFMGIGSIGPIILMAIAPFYAPKELDFLLAPFLMPQGKEWLYIIAVGLFATVSQLLMTKAYSLSKAGIIGAISYSNIIFATIVGIILGDKLPDIITILGIILVIIAGMLVSKKEKPEKGNI
ncbi:MAG: DMT family transporter [Campylobacterales bacterium]|nr:DMT family transporter [Campylobacterales bacterium]